MKLLFSGLFISALMCGVVLAQGTTPSTPQTNSPQPSQASPNGEPQSTATAPASPQAHATQTPPNGLKIAPGSVIPVQLTKTVDAKKAKTGDEVVATVTQDMKTNGGDVLVPKDTRILGHVTEAQARNKEQKESQLGIAFDHAVVKGNESALPMSIQAIIAPPRTSPEAATGGGGAPEAPSSPSPNAGMAGGHSSTASGGATQSAQQNYPQGGGTPESAPQTSARPPITGNTQGVIGIDNVKLDSNAQNATQGSVVTSDKNNVKIEKGTMMLLRVSQ